MLKVLVKITAATVTIGGFLGLIVFVLGLYSWLFGDDPSAGLTIVMSFVFLVFLGGVAVLFRISEQLEEASQCDTKILNAITMLGLTYTEKEKGKEGLEPFARFVETGNVRRT